jgi:lethal(2) giant larvae protein
MIKLSDRHEDGSVQFWDITNISMPLIYKLKTSDYFQIEQAPIDDTDEETWPPFRKVNSKQFNKF